MNRRITITALTLIASLMLTGIMTAQNTTTPITPEVTPDLIPPEVTLEPEATPEIGLDAVQTILGGGIRFVLPESIATGATVESVAAVALSDDMPPGNAMPAHTRIALEGYETGESFVVPELRIFNTADFADYDYGVGEVAGFPAELALLKKLLDERPELYLAPRLPMLPVINAGQLFHARQHYIEFDGGSGIAYLTAYGFDVSPIIEGQVWLSFQGLSDDGQTYISGAFPVDTNYLITKPPEDMDYEAFSNGYALYMLSIRTGLNDQISTVFEPSLTTLTLMLESILVEERSLLTSYPPSGALQWGYVLFN